MTRYRLYQVGLLALTVALIVCAGLLQRPIDEIRLEMDQQSGQEVTEAYTELRLLQAIPGGFRALLIDYLWIRSERLKADGKYYDAEHLTRLICQFQPRFPAVWGNRAWNLAYNVSVKYHRPEDRWRRVRQGIELIRDEGLKYNPKSLPLYLEIARIYQHKVGETMDDMHYAYKTYLAMEYHQVLGSPPPGTNIDDYVAWLDEIDGAPDTDAEFVALYEPAEQDSEAELQRKAVGHEFLDRLAASEVALGLDLLKAYNQWSNDYRVGYYGRPEPVATTDAERELQSLMTDRDLNEPRAAAVAYSRKYVLVNRYRMKPSWMSHITAKYGPIDWRSVWAHSLYWASYGLFNCSNVDLREVDTLNTGRTILISLQYLLAKGHVTLRYNPRTPEEPMLIMSSEGEYVDACQAAYLEMGEFFTGRDDAEQTLDKFRTGHENFLQQCIHQLYLSGDFDAANTYFLYLKKHFTYKNRKLYNLDLQRFFQYTLDKHGVVQQKAADALVGALVKQAYLSAAEGDMEGFRRHRDEAHEKWRLWNNAVTADPRKVLPPFEIVQAAAAINQMYRSPLANAQDLWARIPYQVQLWSYDTIVWRFRRECEQADQDFDVLFPEPADMPRFRQWLKQRTSAARPGAQGDELYRTRDKSRLIP